MFGSHMGVLVRGEGGLKDLNRKEVASLVVQGHSSSRSVFIQHIHDEASMRMKSYAGHDDYFQEALQSRSKLARARSSKIQNNYVGCC